MDERKKIDQSLTTTPTPTVPGTAATPHAITAEESKKTYDPTTCEKRVDKYNNNLINGQKRNFPVTQLLEGLIFR